MSITFLLDEDCQSPALLKAIKKCGHTYHLSVDSLGQGAADAAVRDLACDLTATLITRNKKHFHKALARRSDTKRRCSVLYFMCQTHDEGSARLLALEPLINFEHEICRDLRDPRAIIELSSNRIIFIR